MFSITPAITPPLDSGIVHAALWNREFRHRCAAASEPLAIALARPDGTVSRFDFATLPHTAANAVLNLRYVERLVKFLLWSRGASRVIIGGSPELATELRAIYSHDNAGKFDADFFARIYGSLEIESCAFDAAPPSHETAIPLGRHLDGCRIGFDLGGSDRKCAAVIDGKVVFSEEIAWDPYFQIDPQYHYDGIADTLKRAAAHLPRVDAIGGSAAGVYVGNEVRAASLFRGVPQDAFEKRIRRIFFDLQREWGGVPFEVANDGEVTALAASMSFGENRVLGVSMGTSVAAGYVTASGAITPWLNELAFAPADYRDEAPADEWSGDRGCAVQYFCQQGVARLAPLAGLAFPNGMKFAEQLVEVQNLMTAGDGRARHIYETIGICFGYAIAHYAEFYDIGTLLILGRVTSGEGGSIILEKAGEVLRAEFPTFAERIKLRTPDEKDKRHGQAVAAASLPALRK
ncbi:MAG: ROK family protein [Verrucomicrobia bacterium]|nr:ROK family protein [Verrucomicrobiota bacterium]